MRGDCGEDERERGKGKTSGELRARDGWGGTRRQRTACVVSPQLMCGESCAAKLPEKAAVAHWGRGVITESFCPRLPMVISPTARQLRRRIMKIHSAWMDLSLVCAPSSSFCHLVVVVVDTDRSLLSVQTFPSGCRCCCSCSWKPCTLCTAA